MSDQKDPTFKEIYQITEVELLEIYSLIGGVPHLVDQGLEDLKSLLIDGENNGLIIDFHTMACIVDVLRAKGYAGGMPWAPQGLGGATENG